MAKIRKQRLLDALSLYKLFTEADGVEQWIAEKEKMLHTMVPGKVRLGLFLDFASCMNIDYFVRTSVIKVRLVNNYVNRN